MADRSYITAEDLHEAADRVVDESVMEDVGCMLDECVAFITGSKFHVHSTTIDQAADESVTYGLIIGLYAQKRRMMIQLERYLKTARDEYPMFDVRWTTIDYMLDDVRMRIACGADLEQEFGPDSET